MLQIPRSEIVVTIQCGDERVDELKLTEPWNESAQKICELIEGIAARGRLSIHVLVIGPVISLET